MFCTGSLGHKGASSRGILTLLDTTTAIYDAPKLCG